MASDTITVSQLIERTRRHLLGLHSVPLNKLNLAVGATDETLTFSFPLSTIDEQAYLALEDEIVYVWSVDRSNDTAVVSRGKYGTTAVAHTINAEVETPNRFIRPAIRDALQEEIRAWPDDLFQPKSLELSVGQNTGMVDLGLTDSSFNFVLDVLREPLSGSLYGADKWVPVEFFVHRLMNVSDFASGTALGLRLSARESTRLRVVYGAPFTLGTFADSSDVVTGLGLSRTVLDIAPLGASARLLIGREIQRTDTEAMVEPRLAEQVPGTLITQTATALRRLADRRIGDEIRRLRTRYPVRR